MAFRERLKQGAGKIGGGLKKAYQHPATQKIGSKAKTIGAAGAGLMGGLALGTLRKGRQKAAGVGRDTGTMFLIIAFVIFLLDLSQILGGRYTGFQWVWGFGNLSIISNIVTSSIFGLFMLVYVINKVIRREWNVIGYETVSFVLFAFAMTFFIMNNQWFASPKAVIHFIYILVFGFTFIKSYEDNSTAYIYIVVLLFFDFFGYTWLKDLVIFRYIPLIFLITIFYVYGKTQNRLSIIFFVVLLIILFIFAYKDIEAQEGEFKFITDESGMTLGEWWSDFWQGIRNLGESSRAALESQIQYAITGKVEENQYEPLGVQLVDVEAADEKFYEYDQVVVWGTVKARTLDDIIKIQVGCYLKDNGDRPYKIDDVKPPTPFSVFTLEEQDFVCSFDVCELDADDCILKEGSNTVTAFADFNFETLAYLKTYFINNERLRTMRREGIEDVLGQFGIDEKNPVAVYTNGPVEIGMETTTALIGVRREGYDNYPKPTISISIQNRQGWEGNIRELTELILFVPNNIVLEECPLCEYTHDSKGKSDYKEEDCIASCDKNAENCEGAFCEEKIAECKEVCNSLFKEYDAYSIVIPKRENEEEEFEEHIFFRCSFDPTNVLENTPITTKYFRVTARYNYVVEKPVTVNIEAIEKPEDDDEEAGESSKKKTTEELPECPTTCELSEDECIEFGGYCDTDYNCPSGSMWELKMKCCCIFSPLR